MLDILSLVVNVISVGAFVFSFLAWLRIRRAEDARTAERLRMRASITVTLTCGERERVLPLYLRRAELLGRIGMVPMREAGRRFSLAWLATPMFLAALDEAQQGKGSYVLRIPCSPEEIDQFAI